MALDARRPPARLPRRAPRRRDGLDLSSADRWRDLGDLVIPTGDDAVLSTITEAGASVLGQGARVLALGGDHAVSLPLLRAYGAAHPGLTVLHLDAHPDLYMDLRLSGPLYLSLDLDALDPAFAPGVSHHEPGGFTTRELLGIIQSLPVPLVGADLVELNPVRDPAGITAALAAKLVKEILAQMLHKVPA